MSVLEGPHRVRTSNKAAISIFSDLELEFLCRSYGQIIAFKGKCYSMYDHMRECNMEDLPNVILYGLLLATI